MENKVNINLAEKDYEVVVNFRKSFQLTKFRNKITYGIDFKDADKSILEEIVSLRSQIKEKNIEDVDISGLSPEATKYLMEMSKTKNDIFDDTELVEMGQILTGIEDEEELINIYDKEVELNGFDVLVAKLTQAVSLVFMNAKGISKRGSEKAN